MKYDRERFPITDWAEEDKPREKLNAKGRNTLSNAELVAILLGSGNNKETAVEVARRLLTDQENQLDQLGKLSVKDLMKYRGIGQAKAISIVAAMELGRRRREEKAREKKKIKGSDDVFEYFYGKLADLPHEEFWCLLLDRANKVLDQVPVSRGGVNGTVADPRIIFKPAIERLASSVILCHNHPSGNLRPSKADVTLTNKMKKAGEALDIPILDHLIFSDAGYYSFADEGIL